MDFIDRVGKLVSPPVFLAMDVAVSALDHVPIALHHGGDLFTLVRMDQKHDFVVSQLLSSSRMKASRVSPVRQGVTNCSSAPSYLSPSRGSSVTASEAADLDLPVELKQQDSGRDGDIQARDGAMHRDRDQLVAELSRQAS